MDNNKRLFLIIESILFVVSIIEYTLDLTSNSEATTNIYVLQLLLALSVSYYYSLKELGFFHVFSLVNLTTIVFSLDRFFFYLFGSSAYDFRSIDSLVSITHTEPVMQKAILLYTIFIASTFFSYFYRKDSLSIGQKTKYESLNNDPYYYNMGTKTMKWMFPFAFMASYVMFSTVDRDQMLLVGGSATMMPLYLRVANILFTTGFYIFVASMPSLKDFIKYSGLYFVVAIPILLMGERGEIAVFVLFCCWYLAKMYNYKFNFKVIIPLVIPVMILFQVIAFTRVGKVMESFSFFYLLELFIYSQSISYNLLPLYISYRSQMPPHSIPYFFDGLIAGLYPVSGQNLETLNIRSSFCHHICYTLNPEYYFAGNSLGTSHIAEMYEFGVIGVVIGAFMLSYAIRYFETKTLQKRWILFFSPYFLSQIILSPRGALLPDLYQIVKYVLVFTLIRFIFARIKIHSLS